MLRLASAGRTSSIIPISLLCLAIAGAVWFSRSSGPAPSPADTLEASPSEATIPDQSQALTPAIEAPPTAKDEPSRTVALDSAVPNELDERATTFHETRQLKGRVVSSTPLPSDESLTAFLRTHASGPEPDDIHQFLFMNAHGLPWKTVASTPVRADGTFEFQRPLDVERILIEVEGDYTSARFAFEAEKENDPGDKRLTLDADLGAHVTLRLKIQAATPAASLDALEGDVLSLEYESSRVPSTSRIPTEVALNASGEAVFRHLGPGSWSVSQIDGDNEDQNLAPFVVQPSFRFEVEGGARAVIDVPVRRGQRLEGIVQSSDGAPIAGANVRIRSQWYEGRLAGSSYQIRNTGPDGRFQFQAVAPDASQLDCTAHGFVKREIDREELDSMLSASSPATIELELGRSLTLQATAKDGLPAQGVLVVVQSNSDPQAFRQQKTGEDGIATLVGLPPGPLTLRASGKLLEKDQDEVPVQWKFQRIYQGRGNPIAANDSDVESSWSAAMALGDHDIGSSAPLALRLEPDPMVRGQVVGADPSWSNPVRILIEEDSPRARQLPLAFRLSRSTRSAFVIDRQSGRFQGQIPRGKYTAIAVSSPRLNGPPGPDAPQIQASAQVPFEVADSDVDLLLSFGASRSVTGTVTTSDGSAVPGVVVRLSAREQNYFSMIASARTDAAGDFRFAPQSPRHYSISADSPRFRAATTYPLAIVEGQPVPHQQIEVLAAGAVRVTLLDSEGSADPKVRVTDASGVRTFGRTIENDPEWSGAFGPLLPGFYFVAVSQTLGDGESMVIRRPVKIHAGELAEVTLETPAAPIATATGIITSGGKAQHNLSVTFTVDGHALASGRTDSSGQYTMRLAETGAMMIGSFVPGTRDAFARSVDVVPGHNNIPTIEMPTGAIEARLRKSLNTATSMPLLYRSADPLDGPPYRRCMSVSNGHFRFQFLPDGDYVVTIARGGQRTGDPEHQTPVTVSGGKTARDVKLGP